MTTMMTVLFSAATIGMAAPSSSSPGTDEPEGAYFERLYKDRASIRSGYLEYVVTRVTDTKHKDIEGTASTFRYWFDLDKDNARMDLAEVRPNDPANALNTRFSQVGGTYRFIDKDSPKMCVREYTKKHLAGQVPVGALLSGYRIDPRLLGIVGVEFGLLQHRRLDEFQTGDPRATISVRRFEDKGEALTEVRQVFPRGRTSTYVVSGHSLLPVRIVTEFAKTTPSGGPVPDIRVEVENDLTSWPNARGGPVDFPRKVVSRRIVSGELESMETIEVHVARFNVPIALADLSWKALGPPRGARLVLDSRYQYDAANSQAVAWTGEKFETIPVQPIDLAASAPGPGPEGGWHDGALLRRASFGLAGLAATFGSTMLVLKFVRRRRLAA